MFNRVVYYTMTCDTCKDFFKVPDDTYCEVVMGRRIPLESTKEHIIMYAQAEGWSIVGKRATCPLCRREKHRKESNRLESFVE